MTPQEQAAAHDAATRRWLAATITVHGLRPSTLSRQLERSGPWVGDLLSAKTRLRSEAVAEVLAGLGEPWPDSFEALVLIEGDRELLRLLAERRRSRNWVRHHHTAFRLTRLLVQELVTDDGFTVEITDAGRAVIAQPEEAPMGRIYSPGRPLSGEERAVHGCQVCGREALTGRPFVHRQSIGSRGVIEVVGIEARCAVHGLSQPEEAACPAP